MDCTLASTYQNNKCIDYNFQRPQHKHKWYYNTTRQRHVIPDEGGIYTISCLPDSYACNIGCNCIVLVWSTACAPDCLSIQTMEALWGYYLYIQSWWNIVIFGGLNQCPNSQLTNAVKQIIAHWLCSYWAVLLQLVGL